MPTTRSRTTHASHTNAITSPSKPKAEAEAKLLARLGALHRAGPHADAQRLLLIRGVHHIPRRHALRPGALRKAARACHLQPRSGRSVQRLSFSAGGREAERVEHALQAGTQAGLRKSLVRSMAPAYVRCAQLGSGEGPPPSTTTAVTLRATRSQGSRSARRADPGAAAKAQASARWQALQPDAGPQGAGEASARHASTVIPFSRLTTEPFSKCSMRNRLETKPSNENGRTGSLPNDGSPPISAAAAGAASDSSSAAARAPGSRRRRAASSSGGLAESGRRLGLAGLWLAHCAAASRRLELDAILCKGKKYQECKHIMGCAVLIIV